MHDRQKITIALFLLIAFLSYSFYLYTHQPVTITGSNVKQDQGKLVWQKYNCNACHQIYGLGGYLGPDLTNVYSRRGADYIRTMIENGTIIMPAFHLPKDEMTAITDYLHGIDSTGSADPRTFSIKSNGTISQ
ncbi:MAG: cytochrome c [Ferruginibacter sp.]